MEIIYSYSQFNQPKLLPILKHLEKNLGGKKKSYAVRFGAIDLVSYLKIIVGVAVLPYFKKYLEGLLGFDELKKLGEKHREEIKEFYNYVESNFKKIVEVINYQYISGLPKIKFHDKEEAIVLYLPLGKYSIYITINHLKINNTLVKKLPKGVKNSFEYIFSNKVPDDLHSIQLYFSEKDNEWRYLFIPSTDAYGNFINRYIDLKTKEVQTLKNSKEFIKLFNITNEDKYKFLISPFRNN